MTEIALLVHFKLLNLVDQYEICYHMSFSLNKYLQEDPKFIGNIIVLRTQKVY